MEWGIAINLRESVDEIIEKAIIADEGGLDTIWITDYPATRLSPVLASILAQNTENCRIGVGLLSPLIYPPSQIVRYLTSLIGLYGDRFDLLIGPGDRMKLNKIGIGYGSISTLMDRMTDSLIYIREELSDYENCRIFFGAQGKKMIERSVDAHGILFNYSDSEMIKWAISRLRDRPEQFEIGIFSPSLIGSSKSCEGHLGIEASAAVVALGLSPSIMNRFGLSEKLKPAKKMMSRTGVTTEIVEMIGHDALRRFSICGSMESNMERLTVYQELGVKIIVFGPPQGATLKGVKQLVHAKNEFYSSK